ncbi:bifunctional proline dehydrogenase/L-glutamate gamma-semialdehyde dehydrogenase PutA [Thioclava sp. JE_KL1]|uniref:bifunctional proline dehydrogenase/L-glutamate gamma-semialdehyde dehydrogenase PutA n=1 Tax=Thioclava sp. JE_KL1 TaxID=2651187 RepID=UPI00128D80C0|nr:bifunctional proline dehydrogenase/L-glutamate gamma-semialdehyde dehydrogenase PutA [Thioclava sp. JE_KL1]MPQ94011.1 bifunctional proline dehydrogenase/L-glutamate gamma-semialdehyde dehydrogenase PutA [Thioclava sp. JE_KL1]
MGDTFDQFTTQAKFADEAALLERLKGQAELSESDRTQISARAAKLVRRIRTEAKPTLMEHFLAEYGLSTQEGVALMCLAEAMLRVPDAETIDALIEDKIAPSDWGKHMGTASSSMVNASTWALMLTGRVLEDEKPGMAGVLRGAVRRLGEPVIRAAVSRAMKEMGRQFVLGETIKDALSRAKKLEDRGYTYSYDMLGEAARTARDAKRYAKDYADAIAAIAKVCKDRPVAENPGISVKLSALHPRYEVAKEERAMAEIVPVLKDLAKAAKAGNMGLNIDAEEQDRLVISLKIIKEVLSDPELAGWDGFGVVVQAYGKRASLVIDWLGALAEKLDRKIMVRLVKGAYWDTEMKLAQVEGLPDFPLFTTKAATDVSYLANARKLFSYTDRIYPQFATHNAHSVAAILEMAEGRPYEFQRLHGMGERLHEIVHREEGTRCRIYAPVGAHRDLLAYLVRRLLENGANSSFVHQIVDEDVAPETIAEDPFVQLANAERSAMLKLPSEVFAESRENSTGFDLTDEGTLACIDAARNVAIPDAGPLVAGEATGAAVAVINPSTGEEVAKVTEADEACVAAAIDAARPWQAPVAERAAVLRRVAELYEENFGPFFAVLAKEAGKSQLDSVGELREAVDFLHYYSAQAEESDPTARGIFAAISPWNFPLAIFTGQISAALAAGNGVIAKPAEQTPLVAAIAVRLMHEAGVPRDVLQLLPGQGETVGAALSSNPKIAGIAFTGSTETAKMIRRSMADNLDPTAPLIAETGGLNAMIVDSTALPEQATRDIIASAFQSAGQRCSALRCLYVQEDVAEGLISMIKGAMDELSLGDPWYLSTDVGPVIDGEAQEDIAAYIATAEKEGRVLHKLDVPSKGHFIAPTLVKVSGIEALEREVFGPVLHIATYRAEDIEKVFAAINATGYGLTAGLHSRIDNRVQEVSDALHVGNLYVNRNQIGAVVGSQPFGGEGLSGTGPKAGGPLYLTRFAMAPEASSKNGEWGHKADLDALRKKLAKAAAKAEASEPIEALELPGPTGEANTLRRYPRGPILCLGPGEAAQVAQIKAVEKLGGVAVGADGKIAPEVLETLEDIAGAIWWGHDTRALVKALAKREGPILTLTTGAVQKADVLHERHLCVDTTAAGGNAALLAG